MKVIGEVMERLRLRRLALRARQIGELASNPLLTVYPVERRPAEESCTRVLVVTPHADDETFGAGGTIALHTGAGHDVTVVCCSDNVASMDGSGRSAEEARRVRTAEFRAALDVLGVRSSIMLDLPDEAFQEAQGGEVLRRVIVEIQPCLLYLPSLFDNHEHHRVVNAWSMNAVASHLGTKCRIRGYEVWSPCPATIVVDVSAVRDRKHQAMELYRSQQERIPYTRCIDGLNAYRAMTSGGRFERAEAFLELPAQQYATLASQFLRA